MMNKYLYGFSTTAFVLLGVAQVSHATLIAHDPFGAGYTDGAALLGQDPSVTGWNGAWPEVGDGGGGNLTATATGMTYAGLPTSGGATTGGWGGGWDRYFRPLSATATAATAAADTLYFSGVINRNDSGGSIRINAGTTIPNAWGVNAIEFGVGSAGTYMGSTFTGPSLDEQNGGIYTQGNTDMFIAKMTIDRTAGAADTLELWVSPADFSTEVLAGAPILTMSSDVLGAGDGFTTFGLNLHGGGSTGGSLNVDELRMATTWNEAVGVPEPSTLGLFALAGGLVFLRRRRI